MENKLRRNIVQPISVEKREVIDGENTETKEIIKGYFSVYNSDYQMWPGYIERILPGAFDEVDMSDVVCLFNHEDEALLGRLYNGEGTLKIGFDERGGYFECEKANTTIWSDTYENIRLKNLRGCSFAFTISEQSVEYDVPQEDGSFATVVSISKVKRLYDVGPVVNPAYVETEVEADYRNKIEAGRKPKQELIDLRSQIANLHLENRKK